MRDDAGQSGDKPLRQWLRRQHQWIRTHVPPGLRTVLGLLLVVGGVLGFLPVVGFWMIPLGIAVILMDVRPVLRWFRGRGKRPDADGD